MGDLTIDVEVPEVVVEMYGTRDAVRRTLSQSAVLELVRRREMSSRRGAELLDMDWLEFVRLMGEHGIDYFTEETWQQDLAALAAMGEGGSRVGADRVSARA